MSDEQKPTIGPGKVYTRPVDAPINGEWKEVGRTEESIYEFSRRTTEEFVEKMKPIVDAFTSASVSMETPHAEWKRAMLEKIYGTPLTHHHRQVMLMGTGYRRHKHPGPWDLRLRRGMNEPYARANGATKRVEHARERKLYSERLRRDRRRKRAGRAPILRSSAFQALIPRAQLDPMKPGSEYYGMEVVVSPLVPEDQAYIIDPSVLGQFVEPYALTPPKLFERDLTDYRTSWRNSWMARELTGRLHGRTQRAMNYIIQADAAERKAAGIQGYMPSRIWIDDVEVDVDTWMNEGGAE